MRAILAALMASILLGIGAADEPTWEHVADVHFKDTLIAGIFHTYKMDISEGTLYLTVSQVDGGSAAMVFVPRGA